MIKKVASTQRSGVIDVHKYSITVNEGKVFSRGHDIELAFREVIHRIFDQLTEDIDYIEYEICTWFTFNDEDGNEFHVNISYQEIVNKYANMPSLPVQTIRSNIPIRRHSNVQRLYF